MTLPPWLTKDYSDARPEKQRSVEYYRIRRQRTPAWADPKAIRALERKAKKMRRRGLDVELDHIVPLKHPHVCGLHCEDNLRIIETVTNKAKGNRHWPGMWMEQERLPIDLPREIQLSLRI